MLTINEILNAVEGSELLNGNRTSEINAVVTDTRKVCSNSLFLALKGEKFDGHDYLEDALKGGAAALCISAEFAKKVSGKRTQKKENNPVSNIISVPNTLVAYQQIANYYRNKLSELIVIGITGSCGKTSAKEILKTLLSAVCGEDKVYATESNNNNHIGVPLSLLSIKPEHRFAVIEMGTNHPGEIETLAKIAESNISIITTIARAHLEFLKDLNGVAEEKSAILKSYGEARPPVAIIPETCPGNKIMRDTAGEFLYTFGTKNADINVEYIGGNTKGSEIKFTFSGQFKDAGIPDINVNWHLHGKHQAMNAAAATLALLSIAPGKLKNKIPEIAKALESCHLTGMRMQFSEIDGIEWVNDAYNANPDSMEVAIEWLAEFANKPNSHIVLGDMLEMGEEGPVFHKEILELAMQTLPEANIYTVGPIMKEAGKAERVCATGDGQTSELKSFANSEEAVDELKKILKPGDFVFLKASRGIALEKIQNAL